MLAICCACISRCACMCWLSRFARRVKSSWMSCRLLSFWAMLFCGANTCILANRSTTAERQTRSNLPDIVRYRFDPCRDCSLAHLDPTSTPTASPLANRQKRNKFTKKKLESRVTTDIHQSTTGTQSKHDMNIFPRPEIKLMFSDHLHPTIHSRAAMRFAIVWTDKRDEKATNKFTILLYFLSLSQIKLCGLLCRPIFNQLQCSTWLGEDTFFSRRKQRTPTDALLVAPLLAPFSHSHPLVGRRQRPRRGPHESRRGQESISSSIADVLFVCNRFSISCFATHFSWW